MQQPISEGIRTLLTTHVGVSGWVLYSGIMPETPDRAITVTDTGGTEPNPKWLLDFPAAQIMVRGNVGDYVAVFTEANTIKNILLGLDSQDVGGDRWVSVLVGSDVTFIGFDDNQRPRWVLNLRFIIEPAVEAESNRLAL